MNIMEKLNLKVIILKVKKWKGIGKYFNGVKEYEINNGRGTVYEYHKNGELKYAGEM